MKMLMHLSIVSSSRTGNAKVSARSVLVTHVFKPAYMFCCAQNSATEELGHVQCVVAAGDCIGRFKYHHAPAVRLQCRRSLLRSRCCCVRWSLLHVVVPRDHCLQHVRTISDGATTLVLSRTHRYPVRDFHRHHPIDGLWRRCSQRTRRRIDFDRLLVSATAKAATRCHAAVPS